MQRDLLIQALELLAALALGGAIGFGYDVLRALRRGAAGLSAVLLDAAYCALSAAALFAFAMSTPDGRAGTWALAFMLGGFLLYMRALSRLALPPLTAFAAAINAFMAALRAKTKKYAAKAIFLFQKASKCFIIKGSKGKAEGENAKP